MAQSPRRRDIYGFESRTPHTNNIIGVIIMEYTIDELLEMDIMALSNEELESVNTFISQHYMEDERYTDLLDEVRFAMDINA